MTTAIIGVGNVGGALARHLVRGGEPVMLAAREKPDAAALAGGLGSTGRSARRESPLSNFGFPLASRGDWPPAGTPEPGRCATVGDMQHAPCRLPGARERQVAPLPRSVGGIGG